MAEAVTRYYAKTIGLGNRIIVASAGIKVRNDGEPPVREIINLCKSRGISFHGLKSKRVIEEYFKEFNIILAMDTEQLETLKNMVEPEYANKIHLFMQYSLRLNEDIRVPYDTIRGFENMFDAIEGGVINMLNDGSARMRK